MGTKAFPLALVMCANDLNRRPWVKRWNSPYRACTGSFRIDSTLCKICVMVTQHLPRHTRRPDLAQNVDMLKDHPLLSKQPTAAANLSQNMDAAVTEAHAATCWCVKTDETSGPLNGQLFYEKTTK